MKNDNPSARLSDISKKSKSKKLSNYAKNRTDEHNKKISIAAKGKQRRLNAKLTEQR